MDSQNRVTAFVDEHNMDADPAYRVGVHVVLVDEGGDAVL